MASQAICHCFLPQMAPEIEEVRGDLFSCPPSASLAHCISADVRMGKGIAAIFKRKFGGESELRAQNKKVGEVAVLKPTSDSDRYVYYLITKKRYWEKPTYDDLTASLRAMRAHCSANSVKQLAMPKIGCGLDGLEWKKVRAIIDDIFGDESSPLDKVTVYYM